MIKTIVLSGLVSMSLIAQTESACTASFGNTPCNSKSSMGSGFASYYDGFDGPCFLNGGVHKCFFTYNGVNNYWGEVSDSSDPDCNCPSGAAPQVCFAPTTRSCTADNTIYCNSPYGSSHSGCQYCQYNAGACGLVCNDDTNLTPAEETQILNLHNTLRSTVALGNEPRSRGNEGSQYKATNMIKLVWDSELALIAQKWADQCTGGHDSQRSTPNNPGWVGQNAAYIGNGDISNKNLNELVTMWYDEVADFDRDWINPSVTSSSPAIGHYTALVWAKTTKVGCGFSMAKKNGYFNKRLVCNYHPGGNFNSGQPGHEIYKNGTAPASDCPSGYAAESGSTGLCVLTAAGK